MVHREGAKFGAFSAFFHQNGAEDMPDSYYGRGFIQKKFCTTVALYRFLKDQVDAKLSNVPDSDRGLYYRFVAHVCASMLIVDKHSDQDGPFIPIYSRLIEREFSRRFKVHVLRDTNVIEIKPENIPRGESQEFRLVGDLYKAAVILHNENVNQRWRDLWLKRTGSGKKFPMVNLMTGQRWRSPVINRFKYTNRKGDDFNTPVLIRRSIKALQPFPFRPKKAGSLVNALEQTMKRCKREFEEAERSYDGKNPVMLEKAEKKLSKAKGRLNNCRRAQGTILAQFPVLLSDADGNDPIYTYKAAYNIQKGGRISERGGGFQSASKVFKERCIARVPKLYNYDVKSCQAFILQQELQHCNIKCPWLDDYLNGTVKRKDLAFEANLPEDTWKTVLYAIIMGGIVTEKRGQIYKVIKELYEDAVDIDRDIERRLLELEGHFNPLIEATNEWRNFLYHTNDKRYTYNHGGLKHWRNACGMKFKELGLRSTNGKVTLINRQNGDKVIWRRPQIDKCKRSLSAFILQGQEAAFIHHLTILCSENGISVYRNEHDGLIVGRHICQALVTEAGKRSGFEKPRLRRKPICSPVKKDEYVEYTRS